MKRDPLNPIEAEQALLGAILLDQEGIDRCELRPEHFCRDDHRLIYRWALEARQDGIAVDAITVAEHGERTGELHRAGGLPYMVELANNAPGSRGLPGWAQIIKDAAKRRQAVQIARQLQADIRESGAVGDAITALMGLDREDEAWELSLRQGMTAAYRDLEAAFQRKGELPGVTTGLSKLDKHLGGWIAGDLTIIQARPAMGKTALMLCMAKAGASTGHQIGIISGEQPAAQISARLLSIGSGVALSSIRNGRMDNDEWDRITGAMRRSVDLPVRIYDRSAPTLDTVASQCRKWARTGTKVVFIDYLQRLTCPGTANRREEVSAIARGLKTIARDTNMAVVALAQSVRGVDERGNKRPGLSDIAESADCEREADTVISLYRDEVADPDTKDKGIAELIMCKSRHGEPGTVRVAFLGKCVRFTDLEAGYGFHEMARRGAAA